jgi:membrane-bound lytic murein transglycosylase B
LSLSLITFPSHANAGASHQKTMVKKTSSVSSAVKTENVHFLEWKEVLKFIDFMEAEHQFNKEKLQHIFDGTRFVKSAIQLMKPAASDKPKNWKAYRARFVENFRISTGNAFWDRNEEPLQRAEKIYGVPTEIIIGLIGVETIYGKNTGNFRAIDALTTLAFSYPETPTRDARMAFFRNELAQLLLWSRETETDIFSLKGSYAGALGISQFMPSSLRQYAVDFDGDGTINLKESEADAIGSVANYLAKHGWKKGLPYAFPATIVDLPENADKLKNFLSQGLKASFQIDEFKPFVSTADAQAPQNILYGLVDLQNGSDATEYWLASENFFAITQYNRSYFYAMSVIDLGKVIALSRLKN